MTDVSKDLKTLMRLWKVLKDQNHGFLFQEQKAISINST